MSQDTFEPRIIGFLCNWCSYRAADLAGTARIKHETARLYPHARILQNTTWSLAL